MWWCIVQKIRYLPSRYYILKFFNLLMNKTDMVHHTGNVTVYTKELLLFLLMMFL